MEGGGGVPRDTPPLFFFFFPVFFVPLLWVCMVVGVKMVGA